MDIKVPQPTETLILVADDDLPTRQLLARMLKMEGYRVEMAVDGNEALEKYASLRPNLMLVDALMPQTNGFEVCAKLKAEPDGIPIPIVMITALNDQDSMIRAFEAGAADYTTKPVYWPVLRQRIRRLLLGKEIENELRREQAFASTVLDSVDAVLIVLNSEGRFVRFNRSAEQVSGYSFDEVAGQSWEILIPPDELERLRAEYNRIVEGGTPVPQENHWITKQGQRRLIDWTTTTLRAPDGSVEHIVGSGTDITDRRQAEEAISAERNLLRTLIDNLPDYIFVKDTEGRFVVSNIAHSMAGQAKTTEIVGKTAFESFPQDLAAQYHADDQAIMQDGKSLLNLERVSIDSQGGKKWVLTTKVPLHNSNGEVIGLVGISRDITERKQSEETLRRFASDLEESNERLQALFARVSALEQVKTDMLRMASHDLRAPLTIILGYMHILRMENWSGLTPDSQSSMQEVEAAAERMRKIIDDILSVERIEASSMENMLPLDLCKLTEEVFLENQTRAEHKSQHFALSLPPEPLLVRGDSAQLYIAITNLVTNAIKYTPDDGDIKVRLSLVDDCAEFEVEDTGFGIPEKMQTWLFQPFYRAKTAETTNIDGTGLGLHLVKNVIERHNGQLRFTSNYGKGSTFGFQLPLNSED